MDQLRKVWKFNILYRLKRGVSIFISPSFTCNYDCIYCAVKIPTGNIPNKSEKSLEDWLKLIDTFPYKIKHIVISGGEPTLLPYFKELIGELIKRKILISVYTNLSTNINRWINSSYLRIDATYHHESYNKVQFENKIKYLKRNGYQVIVYEIGKKHLDIPSIVVDKQTTPEELKVSHGIRFGPDMSIALTCHDIFI